MYNPLTSDMGCGVVHGLLGISVHNCLVVMVAHGVGQLVVEVFGPGLVPVRDCTKSSLRLERPVSSYK